MASVDHTKIDIAAIAAKSLLNRHEAAWYLDCSLSTLGEWANQGKIERVYLGARSPRFPKAGLEAMKQSEGAATNG